MKDDFAFWTVDDEEVVTSGLGPEVSQGDYVSFDYFMTIAHRTTRRFSNASGPSSGRTR